MKLLKEEQKNMSVLVENLDDLWYLSTVIDTGDVVSAKTVRKIKLGEVTDRQQKVVKKVVFLSLVVERVDFHKYTSHLRISGKVLEGLEDVPKGSYHTFDVEDGTELVISKDFWPDFQLEKLHEAAKQKKSKILLCLLDRDSVHFALLQRYGYDLVSSFSGDVQQKYSGVEVRGKSFYEQVANVLLEYVARFGLEKIVVASPAFFKDDFFSSLTDARLKGMIVLATCSSADPSAFAEVLRRPELKSALADDRTAKELGLVDELLLEIYRDGKAVYGVRAVGDAVLQGQVSRLLITDGLIAKLRSSDQFGEVEGFLKLAGRAKVEVVVVNSDNDGGRKLDGLGGIGGLLRYKVYS